MSITRLDPGDRDVEVSYLAARSVTTASGCIEWTGFLDRHGYGVCTRRRLAPRPLFVHRLAWMTAHGTIPPGMCVCHHCDNPRCINTEHLFLGSVGDNNLDRDLKGRTAKGDHCAPERRARGERHGRSRLSAAAVADIKRDLRSGIPITTLARANGVCPGTIGHIAAGRHWREVRS
ncbi:MAG: HNH endonuclease signature motif containing protein [Acidiferrobacterales bacterium]